MTLASPVKAIQIEHNEVLGSFITKLTKTYLSTANQKQGDLNLYDLVLESVEAPLLRAVMEMTRYNQSRAARVLGVSRGTLRTKLKCYFDDEFIGTRDQLDFNQNG